MLHSLPKTVSSSYSWTKTDHKIVEHGIAKYCTFILSNINDQLIVRMRGYSKMILWRSRLGKTVFSLCSRSGKSELASALGSLSNTRNKSPRGTCSKHTHDWINDLLKFRIAALRSSMKRILGQAYTMSIYELRYFEVVIVEFLLSPSLFSSIIVRSWSCSRSK